MPFTPSETREVLAKIGHRPKKQLGQNFLVDGNIVKKSLLMSEVPKTRKIVEIGPGLGTLTEELLNQDYQVYAVEIDPRLIAYLQSRFALWIEKKKLLLSEADAVKVPTGSHLLPGQDYSVVANLPYAISSPWLEAVLSKDPIPESMTLMLQKEAADRMWAKPGTKNYNALSIFLHGSFQFISSHPVSRNCFHPVPAVDSILIHMKQNPHPFLFPENSRRLIRKIFTKRRKQMGTIIKQEDTPVREILDRWMEESNLPKSIRPDGIAPYQWQKLAGSIPN
tara:strand:- start:195 stop:1034 length:840 start_codon:yes stop_codon:yes gene_type:complete